MHVVSRTLHTVSAHPLHPEGLCSESRVVSAFSVFRTYGIDRLPIAGTCEVSCKTLQQERNTVKLQSCCFAAAPIPLACTNGGAATEAAQC